MALLVIENATGNEYNMSRVTIEQNIEVICLNETSAGSSECDRSAQGISLSTPITMTTFGVIGNILALIVLYSSRREAHARRTVFFVMLSGLAWTDLIGQFAVSPIAIITYANNLRWVGGAHLCRYHGFMMVSFGVVMPLIVCCMSVERFLAIKFSYYYARHITRRKAQLTFLACCGVTASFTALPFVGFGSYERQYPGSWCFLNFHRESKGDTVYAAMFSSLNIIAIIIMITCNLMVAGTLFRMRRSRQLHSSPSVDRRLSISGVGSTTSGTVIRPKHHSDMEAQMIWFLGLITIAFSVCWLPLNVHILIMQFTGTTNLVLDLMFIRMVSCNQILDPWLYVIFRKNSLLRIIRRVKACCCAKTEPPKNCPTRTPGMRYVLGNKSFICEATTVGRTNAGERRYNISPKLCRHLIKQSDQEVRQNKCSGDSSDSVTQLMSDCSYCDPVSFTQSASNPLADLTPGVSPCASQGNSFSFDFPACSQNLKIHQHGNRQKTGNVNLQNASDVTSPLECDTVESKIKITLSNDLDISPNHLNGPYYSHDFAFHPFIASSKHPDTQFNTPTIPKGKSLFLKSLIASSISSQMSSNIQDSRPQTLHISLEPHLRLCPPLASPEQLSETPSRTESQDNVAIDSSHETNCLSSPNIPFTNGGDHISKVLKINSQFKSNVKIPHEMDNGHLASNSFHARTSSSQDLTDNVQVSRDDEKFHPISESNKRTTEIQSQNSHTKYNKNKISNGASIDFLKGESHYLVSPRISSFPVESKLVTLPCKCGCPTFAGQMNHALKDSVSDARLGALTCLLPNKDHTDHIKCFKAKKTLYMNKNESAFHQKGISRHRNGCENRMVELSFGSRP